MVYWLICTWRHGGHVGGHEQKHFSPLGTKLCFHVNSSRKILLYQPPAWYNVSVKSKLQHAPPGHTPGIWHLCRRGEEGIWLSESSRGWGIWTAPSISCEISGVAKYHGGHGVRGFSWKRLCLLANWLRGKGLNKLCAVFEGIYILRFLILDSGFEYMNVLSCFYNEIQYLYRRSNNPQQ